MLALDRMLAVVSGTDAAVTTSNGGQKHEENDQYSTSDIQMVDAVSTVGSSEEASTVHCLSLRNGMSHADRRDMKTWQKVEFAKLIRSHKHILFGECDGLQVTAKAKEDAWRSIAQELETIGATSFKGKTWMRLRDHDWQYIRRHALSRFESGTINRCSRLTELDEIVMDIVQPPDRNGNNNTTQLDKQKQMCTPAVEEVFKSQLTNFFASCSDGIMPSSLLDVADVQVKEEDVTCGVYTTSESSPLRSSITQPSTPHSHSTPPVPVTLKRSSRAECSVRGSLQAALSNLPLTSSTSLSAIHPNGLNSNGNSNSAPPSAKRTRYRSPEKGVDEQSGAALEREKLQLEIEFMLKEEERRRELHELEVERRRLVNQCIQARLVKELGERLPQEDLTQFINNLTSMFS